MTDVKLITVKYISLATDITSSNHNNNKQILIHRVIIFNAGEIETNRQINYKNDYGNIDPLCADDNNLDS